MASDITVLTLNVWGILHISKLRRPRILEIAHQLSILHPRPQIVCLQECFVHSDFRAIADATAAFLPHAKFFHGGPFGGGLAILSAFPFDEATMIPYALNGRPTAFWRGDWYVGKGVAAATLRIGPDVDDVIQVFNTHTHSPYESGPSDSYLCHRTAQAWQMSKLLRSATRHGHLVLATGDFNMLPVSLQHRIITSRAPVRDTWRVLHPNSAVGSSLHPEEKARGAPVPSAKFNLEENGAASDTVTNTWRWPAAEQAKLGKGPCPVEPDADDPDGKRIDFVFASTGDVARRGAGWVVDSAAVEMTGRHPELNCSLSDHFAVRVTLKKHALAAAASDDRKPSSHDIQLRHNDSHRDALTVADYDGILAMIKWYVSRERSQRFWRGLHFYASVVIWVACLVAVWFVPRNFVAFLLMLLASLGLVSGVVNGLLALLFFNSELRALKEFDWEIRNARTAAAAGAPKSSADTS